MPKPKQQYDIKDIISRAAKAKVTAKKVLAEPAPAKRTKKQAIEETIEELSSTGIAPDPEVLEPEEILVWNHIIEHAPEGLIQEADRFMLEMLCRLMVRTRSREPMTRDDVSTLNQLTARFGMTPKDRMRMKGAEKAKAKPENPFNAL